MKKEHQISWCSVIGADSGIRTRDLVLTKDVLYLLSHISKALSLTSFIILPENRKKVK